MMMTALFPASTLNAAALILDEPFAANSAITPIAADAM